jgi:hypothetical protein
MKPEVLKRGSPSLAESLKRRKPNPQHSPQIQIENGRFMMDYDSVNDKVVIFYVIHNIRDPKGRTIHVYDPATNTFEKPIPVTEKELPPGLGHAFFNAELNAFFVHVGSGDNRQANPYVWRYRRDGKAKLP